MWVEGGAVEGTRQLGDWESGRANEMLSRAEGGGGRQPSAGEAEQRNEGFSAPRAMADAMRDLRMVRRRSAEPEAIRPRMGTLRVRVWTPRSELFYF